MEKPLLVTNTGPLVALGVVERLGLLDEMFHVVVPDAVARELAAGETQRLGAGMRNELRRFAEWADPMSPDPLLAIELDAGEASVIQIARSRGIDFVLIDERKGRRLLRRDDFSSGHERIQRFNAGASWRPTITLRSS